VGDDLGDLVSLLRQKVNLAEQTAHLHMDSISEKANTNGLLGQILDVLRFGSLPIGCWYMMIHQQPGGDE